MNRSKIFIVNPHTGAYGKTVYSWVFKKRVVPRFQYILRLIKEGKLNIFVDGTTSSFPVEYLIQSKKLIKAIAFIEIYLWCLLNGLNIKKVTIVTNKKALDNKRDLLYGSAFIGNNFADNFDKELNIFENYSGKKLLHFTHYFGQTKKVSKNLMRCKDIIPVSEANLLKNSYFKEYFHYINQVYILPFTLRERYKKKRALHKRSDKCLAIGSIHTLKKNKYNTDYMKFFKLDTYHPMRVEIYNNRETMKNTVKSLIAKFPFEGKKIPESFFYQKNKYYKYFYKLVHPEHNKYLSFNIVDEFNNHKMFISPEETIGLPSINFVEGMACGSAYIGIEHDMYKDIGLLPKKHYITYDGTLKDLNETISFYQKHPEELEKIANEGYKFVKRNFSEARVAKLFIKDLENYISTGTLTSSFI